MTDIDPAEIEGGAEAIAHYVRPPEWAREVVMAALAAVLPDHDAGVRAQHEATLEAAGWLRPERRATRAQADEALELVRAQVRADERRRVADRLMASTPAMPPPGYPGRAEVQRQIEVWQRAADIARAHTTEGDTDG